MSAFKSNRKDFGKILASHRRYLETYKELNNGSIEGATPFHVFYTYWTYKTKYADMRILALIAYR